MAIYRSRGASPTDAPATGPAAAQALDTARAGIVRLREQLKKEGMAEAAARIAEAERRAAGADQRVAAIKAELETRFMPVFENLAASVADLENLEAQVIQGCEAEIVRLALSIAARVLRRTVETDPEWMRELVVEALGQIPDRRSVTIRMHPIDAGLARERQQDLVGKVHGLERLEIADDPGLERGACILASMGTTLDASIATAWGRIGERLLQAAPHPPGFVAVNTSSGEG